MIRIAVTVLAISLLAARGAAEVGHFVPGLLNIRDYFQPPEPGVYGAAYNYYYSTDRRNDDHGDEIGSIVVSSRPGTRRRAERAATSTASSIGSNLGSCTVAHIER